MHIIGGVLGIILFGSCFYFFKKEENPGIAVVFASLGLICFIISMCCWYFFLPDAIKTWLHTH